MGKGSFGKVHLRTSHLHHLIVLRSFSGDHEVTGDIGEKDEIGFKFLVVLVRFGKEFAGTDLQLGSLLLGLLGLFPSAFLHQAAHARGDLLLPGKEGIALRLEAAPVGIKLQYLVNYFLRIKILDCKLLDHMLRIVAKHL